MQRTADLVNVVEERARRGRRRAADVVHQAAADEQDQRIQEAIADGSEEAEAHQQLVGGVGVHEDGAERTGRRPPGLPLLRRPGAAFVLVPHCRHANQAHTGRSRENRRKIRSHRTWVFPPSVATKTRGPKDGNACVVV